MNWFKVYFSVFIYLICCFISFVIRFKKPAELDVEGRQGGGLERIKEFKEEGGNKGLRDSEFKGEEIQ